MLIQEMTEPQCLDALEQANFGRLACARDNQPYVLPFHFAYAGQYLYSFATLGRKIEWMRANPRVCVEVDEVTSSDEWMSLVVFGRYVELLDTPRWQRQREIAHDLLAQRAMWWQPACVARAHHSDSHSQTPVYYRIRINEITGHRATPDEAEAVNVSPDTVRPAFYQVWLINILRQAGLKSH